MCHLAIAGNVVRVEVKSEVVGSNEVTFEPADTSLVIVFTKFRHPLKS
jgi:hypothetical protein